VRDSNFKWRILAVKVLATWPKMMTSAVASSAQLGVTEQAFERPVLVGADVDHHARDLPHGPLRFQVCLAVDLHLVELRQRGG
jgi:hypothetical protein